MLVTLLATLAATACASAPADESTKQRIEYGAERSQFGVLYMPAGVDGPAPMVVLVHGGFWQQRFDYTLMDDLALDLVERGYSVWNIEYRRVGPPALSGGFAGTGGWPATGDDVALAIDHVATIARTHRVDPGQVVLVGHSAGGHLALWALGERTSQVSPIGAVGLGAVVDLAYFRQSAALLAGAPAEIPQVYADAAPVLDPRRVVLVQGGADSIVPRASLEVAVDAGVPIALIEGDSHFDLIDPASASWAAAVESINQLLASPPATD